MHGHPYLTLSSMLLDCSWFCISCSSLRVIHIQIKPQILIFFLNCKAITLCVIPNGRDLLEETKFAKNSKIKTNLWHFIKKLSYLAGLSCGMAFELFRSLVMMIYLSRLLPSRLLPFQLINQMQCIEWMDTGIYFWSTYWTTRYVQCPCNAYCMHLVN